MSFKIITVSVWSLQASCQ